MPEAKPEPAREVVIDGVLYVPVSRVTATVRTADEERSMEVVRDLLQILHLYQGYEVRYRSVGGGILRCIDRLMPEVGARLREGDDAGDLMEQFGLDED